MGEIDTHVQWTMEGERKKKKMSGGERKEQHPLINTRNKSGSKMYVRLNRHTNVIS